jgi:peptidoglycan-associated lipoprotein
MKKKAVSTVLWLVGVGWGAGCAHRQQVADDGVKAPVSMQAAREAPAVPPRSRQEQDLAALLQGTVLHFNFDAALLTPESESRLQHLADALRTTPTVRIKISGNCDDLGTSEYNLALGQKRAAVAKTYLVRLGIDASRVDTVSYGEERPVDERDTDEARAANRRDEFLVTAGL